MILRVAETNALQYVTHKIGRQSRPGGFETQISMVLASEKFIKNFYINVTRKQIDSPHSFLESTVKL